MLPDSAMRLIREGMLGVELQLVVAQQRQCINQCLQPVHRRHSVATDIQHQATAFKGRARWRMIKNTASGRSHV